MYYGKDNTLMYQLPKEVEDKIVDEQLKKAEQSMIKAMIDVRKRGKYVSEKDNT